MVKRLKKYFCLIFICFFILENNVWALTGIVNVNDSLSLRSEPTTASTKITSFYNGTELEILNKDAGSGNGCSGNWYQVHYGNYTGYSCSDYITVKKETTYISQDDSYSRENYNNPPSNEGTIMCYEDTTPVSLRSTAGGSRTSNKVNCGENVSILETVEVQNSSCPTYWMKIKRENDIGYLCSYFVGTTKLSTKASQYYQNNSNGDTLLSYKQKLTAAGFPESYTPYLLELHARHPNWNFIAEKININFDDVVDGENGNGANLLEGSAFDVGYLSTNASTYNMFENKFYEYPTERGYYNASKEAIAYYLDPRNYLNEKYIFSFETLTYSNNQNSTVVNSIVNSQPFWNSLYSNGSIGASNDIVNSSQEVGISAVHVASRIKQELGNQLTTSDKRLGASFQYNGVTYSGYYNFYNIGVYGENKILNGMIYALNHDWSTPYKGIRGGAEFLYNSYISLNQDTIYYEKFDVSRSNGRFTHQYMQNLAAPIQEGGIKYTGYINSIASYLDTAITFVIPVYDNMPNYAVTAPKLGNPNNYLQDLKINNNTIPGFSYNTYNYNIYLSNDIKGIDVSASKLVNTSTISGIGQIPIKNDEQTNIVSVTSQNGKVRNYYLHFIREKIAEPYIPDSPATLEEPKPNASTNEIPTEEESNTNNITPDNPNETVEEQQNQEPKPQPTPNINEIMNNSGFKYNENFIFGIELGTNISELIANISNFTHAVSVSIQSSSNDIKNNDIFKTGDTIIINDNNNLLKKYQAIIYGDVNGDGNVSAVDYVQVKNYIMNQYHLEGAYEKAADVNKDGVINAVDYVRIKNSIIGSLKITQ